MTAPFPEYRKCVPDGAQSGHMLDPPFSTSTCTAPSVSPTSAIFHSYSAAEYAILLPSGDTEGPVSSEAGEGVSRVCRLPIRDG